MKEVFTTGEVARLCGVAPRTVSKWFDSGQLRGFKIPGSRDRRIPRESLVRFMRAHQIPLRGLDGAMVRVLIVDADYEGADAVRQGLQRAFGYEVQVATDVFEAGLAAREFRPHVILLDMGLSGLNAAGARQALRGDPELVATRVVAVAPPNGDGQPHVPADAFDAVLAKPYDLRAIARAVEAATDIIV
jgi:excisionase family DNA binding protein